MNTNVLRFALGAALMLILLPACKGGGCETDKDCKGERVCAEGECVEPPTMKPNPQQAPAEAPSSVSALPGTKTGRTPVTPTTSTATRPTCQKCAYDCFDKADSIKKTDPVGARKLAAQICNDKCPLIGATPLHCHEYGLMLDTPGLPAPGAP